MTKEEEALLKAIEDKQTEAVEKALQSATPKEEFEKSMAEIRKSIADMGTNGEKITELEKNLNQFTESLTKFMEVYETEKANGFGGKENELSKAIDSVLDNPKFKSISEGNAKTTGKIEMKAISISGNYTGTTLLTQQSDSVMVQNFNKLDLRDVIRVIEGDPTHPMWSGLEITSIDRAATTLTENGLLPESSFNMKEVTETTKRIGTYLPMSKRLLKSKIFVKNWLLAYLPSAVRQAENFQMVLGDNVGENLKGLSTVAPIFEKELSSAVQTVAAGGIKSVATYNNGKATLIVLSAPLETAIRTGQKLTFSGFANAAYNVTIAANVVNDKTIMVELPYTAQSEDQCKAASFTVQSDLYKSVVAANEVDVIEAAYAYLSYGQYAPTSVVINPMDKYRIGRLKDSMGRNLNLIETINGVGYIGKLPIVELNSMPSGKFLIGDFQNGANLIQYSNMNIEFAEDITSKRANSIAVIVDEEVIFPVMNRFAFVFGDFAACKTNLSV